MNYITIGSTPVDENCAGAGQPDYNTLSRIECTAYKHQLQRLKPNAACELAVKAFDHDFGTYREVIARHSDAQEAIEDAFWFEDNQPNLWDEEAVKELANNGYFVIDGKVVYLPDGLDGVDPRFVNARKEQS